MKKTILYLAALLTLFIAERPHYEYIYIAAHDLEPSHRITKEDITRIRIANLDDSSLFLNNEQQLTNSYVTYDSRIPAGSPFFQSMLTDQAPPHLLPNQTAYTITAASAQIQTVQPGDRIDLYANGEQIAQHARILSVQDTAGNSTTEPEYLGVPSSLSIAVGTDCLARISTSTQYSIVKSEETGSANECSCSELQKKPGD